MHVADYNIEFATKEITSEDDMHEYFTHLPMIATTLENEDFQSCWHKTIVIIKCTILIIPADYYGSNHQHYHHPIQYSSSSAYVTTTNIVITTFHTLSEALSIELRVHCAVKRPPPYILP